MGVRATQEQAAIPACAATAAVALKNAAPIAAANINNSKLTNIAVRAARARLCSTSWWLTQMIAITKKLTT